MAYFQLVRLRFVPEPNVDNLVNVQPNVRGFPYSSSLFQTCPRRPRSKTAMEPNEVERREEEKDAATNQDEKRRQRPSEGNQPMVATGQTSSLARRAKRERSQINE
ncbi:unnamed protein product [Protopolystoma xenopodis]|uniref:Uncharacterized protein n=1 Tax=Protopolystoma xenopodis TaxID=117903 RepID=A0A3S5ATR1_9PLAT|nr:unnamed protein product [Protopolystoma xenopodis]